MADFDPDDFTADSRATWNESATRYDKMSAALFGPIAEEFMVFAGLRKGWRVLEIACGPGVATRAASRRLGEKGSLLATDFSPEMIALAASRPPERRGAPAEFRAMDAQKLDLPDASFDAVICQLGLMLFARPDAALAEMRRVAKPGAPVSCLVQGRRTSMLFTSLVLDAIVARAPQLRAPKGAPTLYSFGPDGILEEAYARAGLTEMVTKRLTGVFRFASPEEYWTTMTDGAGRAGAMLRSLTPEIQAKIKADVLRRAAKRRVGGFVEIPYEFAVARGLAPSRR
ncbi:MAG: class I SAM-dependent methyltransferase [Elusimicrobiota bacterium]